MNAPDVTALEERVRRLEALREVSLELTSERDVQKLLTLIMDRITSILAADRSSLFLVEEIKAPDGAVRPMLVSRVAQGVEEIRLPVDASSIAGWVAHNGKSVNLPDAYQDPRFNRGFDRRHGYRTRSLLAAPMRSPQGRIIGVTQALNKKGAEAFGQRDEELLTAFSSVAAIAVENARWLETQKRTFEALIHGQAVAIDARDHITGGHTWRVTAYTVEIGKTMGLVGDDLELLRYSGLLHDQGKLGVPDDILLKPGKLSEWEFGVIRSHAYKSKVILEAIAPLFPRRLRLVPVIAPAHHEKLDGSGYPDGLKGDQIPLGARILAVADIFDALTAHRPYREPAPDEQVVRMLREDADAGKLDGSVVEALERALPRMVRIRNQINRRIRRKTRSISVLMDVEHGRQMEET